MSTAVVAVLLEAISLERTVYTNWESYIYTYI